jgi:hypothetical protein
MRVFGKLSCGGAFASLLLWSTAVQAQAPDGQWDFNAGNLSATVGTALQYADGDGGVTQTGTQFGTTTALGIPDIGGVVANVMRFSAANTNGNGYLMTAPPISNGGGGLLNDWTLIMDVLYPSAANYQVRPIADVDGSGIDPDPEIGITAGNAFGIADGSAFGQIATNTWYRLGVVATSTNLTFYINGTQVGVAASGGPDARFSVSPGGTVLFFGTMVTATAPGYVNSIQFRSTALTRGQMVALAGPTAAGIPQTIPPVPSYIEKWTPAGAMASRNTDLGAVLNVGDGTVTTASITLKLNGTALASPQITTSGKTITVLKTGVTLPLNTTNTLELAYTDSQAGQKTLTHSFKSVLLYEDFEELALIDAVEEPNGMQNAWTPTPPVGWVTNHSGMPGYGDPANDGRTEWAGWTFAKKDFWIASDNQTRDQFTLAQGTLAIADPDEWDDATHPTTDEQGNSLYFNSFLSTPSINIAGIPADSIYLKFDSSWRPEGFDDWGGTNNQTATVTVSYNGGAAIDVLHWDSKEGGPYYHPDSQNEAIFLQLANPATATNMVITFGLTLGANDWWWAFDNVELSAGVIAPAISTQPQSQLASAFGDVAFNVVATGTEPLAYQWLFNGTAIDGATTNPYTVVNTTTNSAGNYQVVVSNGGGSVTSAVAVLTIFTDPLTNSLVAHLKFDGNYADATGRGNNAAAVNSPTFVTGILGQAVHVNSASSLDPNDYVSLNYPNDLKFGTGDTAADFSFSFWTKVLTNSGDKAFVSNKDWNAGANRGWVVASRTAGVNWNLRDDQSARRDSPTVGPQLADRTNWHHVVVTFERKANAKIYVDGQLLNATSMAPDLGKPVGSLDTDDLGMQVNIGQDGTGTYGSYLDAYIDDFGVWRRALTAQEALAIYTAGLSGKDLTQAAVVGKVPPSISQQPASATIEVGFPVTFTVFASGTEPLAYQWYHNNSPVSGGTASSLTISQVQASDAGTYLVTVGNAAGSVTSAPATLVVAAAPEVLVTGQWDFNNGDLSATVGAALTNFDATVGADTTFGTTTSFGIADIAGSPAKVMYFAPSGGAWGGYIMPHGASPNGGGSYVNRYTIIYDIYYPAASDAKWRSLLQTSPSNGNDGDLFINGANGIGISGSYQGSVVADTWNRIVAVFDLPNKALKKYLNGVFLSAQTLGEGTDGRWSLDPVALLFADEDGETNPGYVNSIQFRNGVMTDAEVLALGSVTTDGIPGMRPKISAITLSGSSVTITWTGAPGMKLQQNSTPSSTGWTDVPGSTGVSTITVPATGSAGFFRLAQ